MWPAWCGIAPAAVRAGVEAQVLPALCRLAQEALRAVRAQFAPLLPQTAAVLTSAFDASPSAPLLELADALLEAFAGAATAEEAAAFASLLDTLSARTLRALGASPLEQPALLAALLSHADLHAKLLTPSLATAASMPALLSLAASLLGTCREPEPLDAAMSLLGAAAAAARGTAAQLGYTGTEAEAAAHRARLQAALGAAGEAVVRGAIVGLVETLPEPSWPCIADMVAPMLHLEPWARPNGLRAWAHAALAALPATGGAPDARCREALLTLLCAFPDPCTAAQRVMRRPPRPLEPAWASLSLRLPFRLGPLQRTPLRPSLACKPLVAPRGSPSAVACVPRQRSSRPSTNRRVHPTTGSSVSSVPRSLTSRAWRAGCSLHTASTPQGTTGAPPCRRARSQASAPTLTACGERSGSGRGLKLSLLDVIVLSQGDVSGKAHHFIRFI